MADAGLGLFRRQFDEALANIAVGKAGLVMGCNIIADVPPGELLVAKLPDEVEEPDADESATSTYPKMSPKASP